MATSFLDMNQVQVLTSNLIIPVYKESLQAEFKLEACRWSFNPSYQTHHVKSVKGSFTQMAAAKPMNTGVVSKAKHAIWVPKNNWTSDEGLPTAKNRKYISRHYRTHSPIEIMDNLQNSIHEDLREAFYAMSKDFLSNIFGANLIDRADGAGVVSNTYDQEIVADGYTAGSGTTKIDFGTETDENVKMTILLKAIREACSAIRSRTGSPNLPVLVIIQMELAERLSLYLTTQGGRFEGIPTNYPDIDSTLVGCYAIGNGIVIVPKTADVFSADSTNRNFVCIMPGGAIADAVPESHYYTGISQGNRIYGEFGKITNQTPYSDYIPATPSSIFGKGQLSKLVNYQPIMGNNINQNIIKITILDEDSQADLSTSWTIDMSWGFARRDWKMIQRLQWVFGNDA